jgi:hypothetical protein
MVEILRSWRTGMASPCHALSKMTLHLFNVRDEVTLRAVVSRVFTLYSA